MATARSFAQHFIECENCEENPAQFLCKTCPGHLCETCKTVHETRKISKNHEIIHLHRNREEALGLLFCGKHTVNKLEWYCSPCNKPVCKKCLMESHNGHEMEHLAAIYQEIIRKLKREKEEIEGVLLPKYREMLSKENTKKSEISKRAREVKRQIENHAKSITDQVTKLKENAIQNLQQEEKKALESVEDTEHEIERRIKTLGRINEDITNNMGANPGITFFTNIDSNTLRDMRGFPITVNYKLDDFQSVKLFLTEQQFGKSPEFSKSKDSNLTTEQSKAIIAIRQRIEQLELREIHSKGLVNMIFTREQIRQLKQSLKRLESNEN